MTTTVKGHAIPVSEEILAAAGIEDGDWVHVDVSDDGVIHVEHTRIYESGAAPDDDEELTEEDRDAVREGLAEPGVPCAE